MSNYKIYFKKAIFKFFYLFFDILKNLSKLKKIFLFKKLMKNIPNNSPINWKKETKPNFFQLITKDKVRSILLVWTLSFITWLWTVWVLLNKPETKETKNYTSWKIKQPEKKEEEKEIEIKLEDNTPQKPISTQEETIQQTDKIATEIEKTWTATISNSDDIKQLLKYLKNNPE